ncbi:MAG: major capsid protein V20 domain-containing protein, partial [Pirellulaceae bacterium]
TVSVNMNDVSNPNGKTQSNNSGIYGIQNMSFNFNIGDASTVWRHYGVVAAAAGDTSQITAVQLVSFQNSRLICQFLTPHPSDQLSSRCCVPFYELPRYITSNLPTANPLPNPTFRENKLVPAYVEYSSSTISLNQVPDKLIIFLRRKTRTWVHTDTFLAINKVNINWNNQTGILSSFDQQSLWRMSREAGSNQSFDEFRGYAYRLVV